MHPDLFPTDECVIDLQSTLQTQGDHPDKRTVVALSWALRERDSAQALRLADMALARGDDDPRLDLVRAEARWLKGDLSGASAGACGARLRLASLGDRVGEGDAVWMLAYLAQEDAGRRPEVDGMLAEAEALYRQGGDEKRARITQLRRFSRRAYAEDAAKRWETLKPQGAESQCPATAAWELFCAAILRALQGHAAEMVALAIRAMHEARRSGQGRLAVFCAANISASLESLNDLEGSLEWARQAQGYAEPMHSRTLDSMCQCLLGGVLVRLQRLEAAAPVLEAALANATPRSTQYVSALAGLGNIALALGDAAGAYKRYAEAAVAAADMPAVLADRRADQARAALRLGNVREAQDLCTALLDQSRAKSNGPATVDLLLLQAHIRRAERGPDSRDTAAMECLMEALQIAEGTTGLTVSHELLDAIAEESAHLGDMAAAYAFGKRARQASDQIRSRQAGDRAGALQVQRETERHRLEADHEREVGRQQQQRAEELAQANATLERLGAIGREITAAQTEPEIFATIARHLDTLLDAHSIAGFRAVDGERLEMVFGCEDGRELPAMSFAFADPDRLVSRCARDRVEISLDDASGLAATAPGTAESASIMAAPLQVGREVVGVLTIQSPRRSAYGERELAIFKSLCAYAAVALGNAQAMAALTIAREHLAQQNAELARLAATDRLTGLPNRRQLDAVLEREVAAGRRSRTPFAVVLLDVDHFKRVNDVFGHGVGDIVLSGIGRLLSERVRGSDIPGRFGGEEFLVVLPGADLGRAWRAAESLRTLIEALEHAHVGRCTASFGVAAYRPGDDAASIVARADKALYAAKAAGRNQVAGEEEGPEGPPEKGAPPEGGANTANAGRCRHRSLSPPTHAV